MTMSASPPSSELQMGQGSVMSRTEMELVRRLRAGRTSLPLLPHVAAVALGLANDNDASVLELAELVDGDPPIAARFLSVANSAAYWRGFSASSTQAAIVRLGLAATRDLLFQVVYASSSKGLKRFQQAVQRSFSRSVTAGIATREIARELKQPYEYAYMAGLLHDIGEARVYRILAALPEPPTDQALVEDLVSRYHTTAGAEIAMAWRLPSDIVDVCAAHHDEDAADKPHIRLVMLADAVVSAIEHHKKRGWEPLDFSRFEELGVDRAQAESFIGHTRVAASPGLDADPERLSSPASRSRPAGTASRRPRLSGGPR